MDHITLNVLLRRDRNIGGHLRLIHNGDPVAEYQVLGRGSRGGGDTSMLQNGNTPTGDYSGNTVVETSQWPQDSYGPWGAVRLKPLDGNALEASRLGRSGLLIHGGSRGGKGYWRGEGELRATHGCIRISNADMKNLLETLNFISIKNNNSSCSQLDIKVSVKEW